MNTTTEHVTNRAHGVRERYAQRLRNARARRRLERLQDKQVLRHWLTDVWDETPQSEGSGPH